MIPGEHSKHFVADSSVNLSSQSNESSYIIPSNTKGIILAKLNFWTKEQTLSKKLEKTVLIKYKESKENYTATSALLV